jgi:Fungal hydrophobin
LTNSHIDKMKFSLALATLFAGVAMAMPASLEERQYVPCSGLYNDAQCCATDVLGVADLDCVNRSSRL